MIFSHTCFVIAPIYSNLRTIRVCGLFFHIHNRNTYTVKNGKLKHLLHTNLQFIEPTEYLIISPTTITIYEYKIKEISNKNFYIKEHNQKYNLKEINIEYRTTIINFANYPYIIFVSAKIMEMNSTQQNKVVLYLFNSINFNIKKCKSIDNKEQMF